MKDSVRLDSAQAVADLLKRRPLRIVTAQAAWGAVSAPSPEREQWSRENGHGHPHREILLPLAGETVFGLGGRFYPCLPGVAICLDVNDVHDQLYPEDSPPLEHLWLSLLPGHATGAYLHSDGQVQCARRRVLRYEDVGLLPGVLWPGPADGCSPDRIRARLRLVAETLLLRWFELTEEEGTADEGDFQRRVVRAIQRHIDDTAGRDLCCKDLARIAGYSPFHFLRLFKEHAGCTVQQYIDASRLRRTQTLLAEGRRAKDITAELGFSCPAAFSRWRRKHGV